MLDDKNKDAEINQDEVVDDQNHDNQPAKEGVDADATTTNEQVDAPSTEDNTSVTNEDADVDAEPTDAAKVEEEGADDAESVTTEEEEKEAEPEVVKPVNDKKWYSLRVISGKERKIKERIELEIQRSGWKEFVTQILVPTEKVYKIRAGKKVISERNILPGYILIEALPKKFSGEMVTTISNIPNVIHFLGRNNPIPMQQSEANRMLGKVDESQNASEALIEPFIVGETVKIIDGPFNEFVGDIQEVNEEKKKLKVIVKIFGRGTEVELNFMQVEKQS